MYQSANVCVLTGGAEDSRGVGIRGLVQRPSAVLCSTQARNLVLLQRELVVVGDFFIDGDGLLRVDDDLLLGLDGDHLGVTVWLEEQSKGTGVSGGGGVGVERLCSATHSAAVVDESRQVATLGGVYDGVVVHSKQVAAPDALLRIPLLPIVRHHLGHMTHKPPSAKLWRALVQSGARLTGAAPV